MTALQLKPQKAKQSSTQRREQMLIADCLNGRPGAFAALVKPYQDRLFTTLRQYLGNRDEAADTLQETLLRAYRALGTFRGSASFYTWLNRIAVNAARTRIARRRRRPVSTDSLSDTFGNEIPDPKECSRPSWKMESRDRKQTVQAALDALPPEHRIVLVLRDMEGFRYVQIAKTLGIPLGTVRSRLYRARTAVLEQLRPLRKEGLL